MQMSLAKNVGKLFYNLVYTLHNINEFKSDFKLKIAMNYLN